MEWKTLKYNEQLWPNYEISDTGVLRSITRFEKSGTSVRRRVGREIKYYLDKDGYKKCSVYHHGICKCISLHRAVICSFVGYDHTKEVNHIDEDKGNNILSNLEWVTSVENSNHSKHKQSGDLHPTRVLSVKDVVDIKKRLQLYKRGDVARIAKDYKVHISTISKIKTGVNHNE